jgi:hypothetical protein
MEAQMNMTRKTPLFFSLFLIGLMSLLLACLAASPSRVKPTPTPTKPPAQFNVPNHSPGSSGGTPQPGTNPQTVETSQPAATNLPPTSPAATAGANDEGLQPGKYSGTFNMDLKCQTTPASSNGSKVQYTGILNIQGTVDLTVTGPKTGRSLISYNADSHLLNAIYYVSNHTGMSFTDTVTLSADPTVVFLATLVDNYDPGKQLFAHVATFSDPQNENIQIDHQGATWNGREEIDKKTTQAYLAAFLPVVKEIDLHVLDSQNGLSGDVQAPDLRGDCSVSGDWQASTTGK